MQDYLIIKGARVHNLKNISLNIPRNRLVVITGPSGSGKSSLAFDTIYAEGHRRYMESLSAYAKQFIQHLQKPDVDFIEGLSPSIAIDQKTVTRTQRSTIGTLTGAYDYLRVLYTRIGKPFCYECGQPIVTQGLDELIGAIYSLPERTKIQILSPLVVGRKGEYKKELADIRKKGFIRARIDGKIVDLTGGVKLDRYKRHDIDVVVDRLLIKPDIKKRLTESIGLALKFSDFVVINIMDEERDIIFSKSLTCRHCNVGYPEINASFFSFNSIYGFCPTCKGLGTLDSWQDNARVCDTCQGFRLRKEALHIKINNHHIGEISSLSIEQARKFFDTLSLTERESQIGSRILKAIREKLEFLGKIGVSYLTLERPVFTLSGGEVQRVRIATQLGSSLTGVTYILDEPSIGLHPSDCEALLASLTELRDMNNTVIVVEHDEETINKADFIVDMGLTGGIQGGYVVVAGSRSQVIAEKSSPTGLYLRGERKIDIPGKRRIGKKNITVRGASAYNLKAIDVTFPIGLLICVTGVSGSGKSTLVYEIVYKAFSKKLYRAKETPGSHLSIEGMENVDKVILIDQSPLGRTPRSNPATYTGMFDIIRSLFASLPESKVRGYKPGRFSFNVPGGRCEACKGDGNIRMAMHFLPDVFVLCELCGGSRFNRETLEIRYKGKSISEVLEMTVSNALEFFRPIPMLRDRLMTLERVGLGYIKLGQPASTLSGGEAQRIKLSRELIRKATGKTLYLLDEPTTGLHFVDIENLLTILHELVDKGNTVIVIEHHLDIIKSADYVVDLGPMGGQEGGYLVASGTPEDVAKHPKSLTGKFLRRKLNPFK